MRLVRSGHLNEKPGVGVWIVDRMQCQECGAYVDAAITLDSA